MHRWNCRVVFWGLGTLLCLLLGKANSFNADFQLGNGTLGKPGGLAFDPIARTLFVSDSDNNRVLRYDNIDSLPASKGPSVLFGQVNMTETSPNRNLSAPNAATLYRPLGIDLDSSGTLWVCDSLNNRVLWYYNASRITASGVRADGFLGQQNFSSAIPAVSQIGITNPFDISVENGFVWVADQYAMRYFSFFFIIFSFQHQTNATGCLSIRCLPAHLPTIQPLLGW